MSSLNSRQAVHKYYRAASHWRSGQESEVTIELLCIYGLISDTWQLTALFHCGFTSALTLMSLYYSSILCSQNCWHDYPLCVQVLKTFNHHFNHKCEFTIITERLYAIIFDTLYGSSILSSPLFTLGNDYKGIIFSAPGFWILEYQLVMNSASLHVVKVVIPCSKGLASLQVLSEIISKGTLDSS